MSSLAVHLVVESRAHAASADPDAAAVEAARSDPRAFTPVYRRHYTGIVGYLYRRLGDAHVAEDLAAETFIAALEGLGRYRPTKAPFRAWLFRIATNLANNHVRTTARRRSRLPTIERWQRDHAESLGEADQVRAALLALSTPHQTVLSLQLVEGLSIDETALVLGVRPGTVKSRLSRARRALQEQLERGDD